MGRPELFRNDGGKRFTRVTEKSGLPEWVNAGTATWLDYDRDGRVDLAVAQNAAETKLFHNQRAEPGLRVRLKGPPGNPDGVGAVVRLRNGESYGPAREVRGGAGHMSQDSATLVLGPRRTATQVTVRWPGGRRADVPVSTEPQEIVIEFQE